MLWLYISCYVVLCGVVFIHFFFFKQKTAYEMRISDWSSDVCSSDLDPIGFRVEPGDVLARVGIFHIMLVVPDPHADVKFVVDDTDSEIGRASCRERVCQYV